MYYYLFVFCCFVSAVLSAPAPQLSPISQPQVIFWSYPGYPQYPLLQPSIPVMATPRSLISFPLAVVASQDAASRGISQPIGAFEKVKTAKMMQGADDHEIENGAHERSKRDAQPKSEEPIIETSEDKTEHPSSIQKRQAAFVSPLQMPWTMPILSLPLSYTWSAQSFVAPSGSSSWSYMTL